MKLCPVCYQRNDDWQNTCHRCGGILPQEPCDHMVCPICKKEYDLHMEKCDECGVYLRAVSHPRRAVHKLSLWKYIIAIIAPIVGLMIATGIFSVNMKADKRLTVFSAVCLGLWILILFAYTVLQTFA